MNDKHRLLFQNEDGTVITRAQLEDIISSSVAKASEKKCRFPINDEQVNESLHFCGMLADIGDGDISKGIEETRKNNVYISKIRLKSDKFSTYFFMVIIAAITGGLLKVTWEGIKSIAIPK